MCMLQFQTAGAVLGDWVFNVVANFNKTSSLTTALGEEGVCRETEDSCTWGGSHAQAARVKTGLRRKSPGHTFTCDWLTAELWENTPHRQSPAAPSHLQLFPLVSQSLTFWHSGPISVFVSLCLSLLSLYLFVSLSVCFYMCVTLSPVSSAYSPPVSVDRSTYAEI